FYGAHWPFPNPLRFAKRKQPTVASRSFNEYHVTGSAALPLRVSLQLCAGHHPIRSALMAESDTSPLTIGELEQALLATDPAALLVPPRILRRVIKHARRVPGIGLQVPHRKTFVIGREQLLALTERDELGLSPERNLPEQVLLLARPRSESPDN